MERETRVFPARCAIHSPTHSGVRVTAEMKAYLPSLYEVPGPLIVVEDGSTFLGLTWGPWNPRIGYTKPDIELLEDGWRIQFPAGTQVREYPRESSLAAAVAHYRKDHEMPSPPGKTVLDRIRRCIFVDMWLVNTWWDRGPSIAHTYADVCRLLRELDTMHRAEGTVLYLPGWHASYDSLMPKWEPADELGGRAGFREMVDLSKSVGAIIMPHMNFWGYDRNSGLLENWEEAWTGSRWPGHSGLCPGYPIEYMWIDHPRWIELFDRYFDRTVSEFGLEAVFLDQCGNANESPKGDMVQATQHLLERIHGKFPNLLLGAEVLSEHVVDHIPFIQATWVMEGNLGKFSPITRLMFEDRIRFFPHLFLAAAVPCRYAYTNMPLIVDHGVEKAFEWYQENNRQLGGVPSVRLDYSRSGIDPASRRVLENS